MSAKDLGARALIVGASRGLGLALAAEYLARGWRVIATERTASSGLRDLAKRFPDQLTIETIDIAVDDRVRRLRDRLQGQRLDLLFVNAGIANGPAETIADVSTDEFCRIMVTNALSPLRVIEALEALVPDDGTIGVMSSGLGSVANNVNGGWEIYRASKAALNMLMRSFAARHAGDGRSIVIIAPGWVRTDMGGPTAALAIEESIPRVVDVLLGQRGKPGIAYLTYRNENVPW